MTDSQKAPVATVVNAAFPTAIGGRLFTRRQRRTEVYCRIGAHGQRELESFPDGVGVPRPITINE
jgi:hypothetical protein